MKVLESAFMQGFIRVCDDAFQKGWHERNGGNLSYRIRPEEVDSVRGELSADKPFAPIGVSVPNLASEYFAVTGSGKYFRNVPLAPQDNAAIIELDDKGENYRIVWGLEQGGRPTSELPTHLMNHSIKKELTHGEHRVIQHSHPANTIALTFVLPLEDQVFTRELWEMATECPIVFPAGVGRHSLDGAGRPRNCAGHRRDDEKVRCGHLGASRRILLRPGL
jgi:rhamnulose-1-phosphate aldolase